MAEGVSGLALGTRVAVNPARACGACEACRGGRRNLCSRTIMLGSASTRPPTDGAFAELVAVRADQCHALPDVARRWRRCDDRAAGGRAPRRAPGRAARGQARAGLGRGHDRPARGDGRPRARARRASSRATSRRDGASARSGSAPITRSTRRTRRSRSSVRELAGDGFDVVVEAAGAPASLRRAFELVRPGGTIVQVGTLGAADVPLPANQLMNRELQLVGSFRYGDEFADAIGLVATRRRQGRRAGERGLPARRGRARLDAGRRHRLGDQGPDRGHARRLT